VLSEDVFEGADLVDAVGLGIVELGLEAEG
jgi:hypothetical protein